MKTTESSPTRGTWIEMEHMSKISIVLAGRPPHGGRGLKYGMGTVSLLAEKASSPTRGTWIEILHALSSSILLSSSPTRGTWIEICGAVYRRRKGQGRPPHGGRGLKSRLPQRDMRRNTVVPHTGDVD